MNWKILLGALGIIVFLTGAGIHWIGWGGGHPMLVMGAGLVIVVAALALSFREVQRFALKRAARYGLMSVAMSVIVVAITFFVARISMNHPARMDLSENKRFSLAAQTQELLRKLEKPVHAVAFFQTLGSPELAKTEDLLEEMKRHAEGNLTFEVIDPIRNPELALDYMDELQKSGLPSIFVTRQDELTGTLAKERTKGVTEPDITNALIRLTRERQAMVYFLTGHGEREINETGAYGYSALKSDLENLQYTAAEFSFTLAYGVPEDCDVLAVCGPEADLYVEELEALDRFVKRGGRVLAMVDPDKAPNLARQLRAYGLDMKEDIVVEAKLGAESLEAFLMGRLRLDVDPAPLVGPDGYNETHEITRGFRLQTRYIFARSVMPLLEKPTGVTVTKLAETRSEPVNDEIPGSWGESEVEAVLGAVKNRQPIQVQFNAELDTRGPVSLVTAVTVDLNQFGGAAAPEDRVNDEEARLVVFGDSDFCLNQYYRAGQGEIATNAFSWLTEQEDLISAEMAKVTRNTAFILNSTQKNTIRTVTIFFLPLTVVVIGILNAIRRRKFA